MAVNVIIPIKDTPIEFFENCMYSLAGQTKKSFLTTIIDDTSSEENFQKYMEIINKLPLTVKVIKHSVNKGPGPARQTGIDAAPSFIDYFLFVDADDMLFPNTIKTLYREAKLHPEADIIAGGILVEGITSSEDYFIDIDKNHTWATGKLYKRKFLDQYNIRFLDEKMSSAEDCYFSYVVTTLSNKTLYIRKPVYF